MSEGQEHSDQGSEDRGHTFPGVREMGEEDYKELVDQLPEIIFETDPDLNLIFVNQAGLDMIGYTESDIGKGVKAPDLIALEDRARALSNFQLIMSGKTPDERYTLLRSDGSRFPAILHSRVIYRHGKAFGLRGVAIDISWQKQTEEMLLLMQASIDNFHDPCTWAGENGRFHYINEAMCQSLGYTREELLQMRIPDIDALHDGKNFDEAYARVKATGGLRFESLHRAKDGRIFPVEISTKCIRYGEKEYVISIERDITERKASEERLKNSLREKELLLKEVHHRVKNNMQIISSLLNLQISSIEDAQVRIVLEESKNRIRSIALVHDRIYQSGDMACIDFKEYAKSLGIQLRQSYADTLGRVCLSIEGDRLLLGVDKAVPLGLILNELVSNCYAHAFPDPRRGTITISFEAGDSARITVRDDGVGISGRLNQASTGTIGLQVIHALVDQLSGTIDFECTEGTSVTIKFPAVTHKG